MSAAGRAPRCTQCGYVLTGSVSGRCPECGHQSRAREHWREGELHLEGPPVVTQVFMQALIACVMLCVGVLMFLLLDADVLDVIGIRTSIDARWAVVPMALLAPPVGWLLTRPLPSRDAHLFDLHASSPWRTWLAAPLVVWWLIALLRVVDIQASAARAAAAAASGTKLVPDDTLLVLCSVLGILGQIPWILVLRHVGRVGAYLRDPALRTIASVWTWVWVAVLVLSPFASGFVQHYTGNGSAAGVVLSLFGFSCLGFVVGAAMSCRLFWTLANCLTLAHEAVERENRRTERERRRTIVRD